MNTQRILEETGIQTGPDSKQIVTVDTRPGNREPFQHFIDGQLTNESNSIEVTFNRVRHFQELGLPLDPAGLTPENWKARLEAIPEADNKPKLPAGDAARLRQLVRDNPGKVNWAEMSRAGYVRLHTDANRRRMNATAKLPGVTVFEGKP